MKNINTLARMIGRNLQAKHAMMATAESCTGGGIAYAITSIPGSSEWFDRSFVTYSNASKVDMLGVPSALIAENGAVSEEVAIAMVKGVLARSHSDFTVSVTGIAGPGGAVPGKPVGTIYFAWASAHNIYTKRMVFSGNRHAVRKQTIKYALQELLAFIG
ncbi:MAG: CinA family protein [Pseudomonadota bacterium]